MRRVFILVLMLGILLAGFAVYKTKGYIEQQQMLAKSQKNESAVPLAEVFVAKRSLKYGEALTKADVRLVHWPQDAIPEGTFVRGDDLFAETGEFRTVLRAMEQDEAIMRVKLTEPGQDAGLTSQLTRGMRAFAIKVDVTSGVSGFLRPGDRVDVYWTGKSVQTERAASEVTKLIEAGVRLIAVDQTSDGDAAETAIARTVTVSVTPQQVAALAQAQSTGRLSLSLVGNDDDTVANAVEVDQRTLLGIAAAEEKVIPQEAEICTIRTRRGAEVVEIPIPCTN